MKPFLLARFTPSLTAPEDLEAIFVQRELLAERLLAQLQDSITTANKHYTLLVGPRGIGKTHLITIIQHRLASRANLRPLCLIAWLREEEWGVMSFLDLLLRIIRSLKEAQESDVPDDRVDALHNLTPAKAEKEAAKLLLELIEKKTLVLLIENLDDIFRGLAQREQAAFRAFIQDHGCMTILATTPGLFEDVSRRQSPFFGFFRIQHLEELTFEDAVQLLHKIALRREQHDLAKFILTPTGRARIRAIHHLAQGNPRVYVILSEFLTRQSLDDLVDPVLRMLDDLTPYYQSRLAWLSPQQRKIAEFLASYRIPCSVKELARRCFITQQTASSQLRKLVEWGYVRFESEGRESYYELREPLMRFCLDLKKERKEPLRPLVEILRIWWTPDELELQLRGLEADVSPTAKYLVKALELCGKNSKDPRVEACRKDFQKFFEAQQHTNALAVAEDWVAVSPTWEALLHLGLAQMTLNQSDLAIKTLARVLTIDPNNFVALFLSSATAAATKDFATAIRTADLALSQIKSQKEFLDQHNLLISFKIASLFGSKKYEECIACCDQITPQFPKQTIEALAVIKAKAFLALRHFEEAEKVLNAQQSIANDEIYFLLAGTNDRLKKNREAIAAIDKAILINSSVKNRLGKARILSNQGQWDLVMPEIGSALEIAPSEVGKFIGMITTIAAVAMLRPDGGFREFFTALNNRLRTHNISEIRVADVIASIARQVATEGDSSRIQRLSEFFRKIPSTAEDQKALNLLEVVLEYIRNKDASVLRRLSLEERQLMTMLNKN